MGEIPRKKALFTHDSRRERPLVEMIASGFKMTPELKKSTGELKDGMHAAYALFLKE